LQARLLSNTVRVPRHLRLLLGSSHTVLLSAREGFSDFERGAVVLIFKVEAEEKENRFRTSS